MSRARCTAPPRSGLLVVPALALLSGCATLTRSIRSAAATQEGRGRSVHDPGDPALQQRRRCAEGQRYKVAITQFDLVQENYPYSPWATNAMLMQGYSRIPGGQYTNAIGTLDHFIQLHPAHHDIAYAYYLRALCFYEQIEDVQRDQKSTEEAMGALREVVNRFPDSAYARDARLKIDLCSDHLAGKEMAIGRWYKSQHLYTAAIGRFQRVVDDFQTTNHVPEALHRLVEIYLKLGLVSEARRTAAVLGYNYPGSSWYRTATATWCATAT